MSHLVLKTSHLTSVHGTAHSLFAAAGIEQSFCRLGLDDDKPAVREDRKRGWDDNQGWKSVAKVPLSIASEFLLLNESRMDAMSGVFIPQVAPSEHDEEVSREVKPRWCGGKMAAYL